MFLQPYVSEGLREISALVADDLRDALGGSSRDPAKLGVASPRERAAEPDAGSIDAEEAFVPAPQV